MFDSYLIHTWTHNWLYMWIRLILDSYLTHTWLIPVPMLDPILDSLLDHACMYVCMYVYMYQFNYKPSWSSIIELPLQAARAAFRDNPSTNHHHHHHHPHHHHSSSCPFKPQGRLSRTAKPSITMHQHHHHHVWLIFDSYLNSYLTHISGSDSYLTDT